MSLNQQEKNITLIVFAVIRFVFHYTQLLLVLGVLIVQSLPKNYVVIITAPHVLKTHTHLTIILNILVIKMLIIMVIKYSQEI